MTLETVKLVKLSVCKCGYGVLLDSIRVGTEYIVDKDSIRGGFFYRCGRCGTNQIDVRVINAEVHSRPNQGLKPIPAELFGL